MLPVDLLFAQSLQASMESILVKIFALALALS
jgi:hypothetical protein